VLPVLPVMQPPPRCSRSAQPSLLIARADPDPDNLRGACWLQSWVETAARTCLWAACGLPATTALPAAGALLRCALLVALCARALLQQPHPCSGSDKWVPRFENAIGAHLVFLTFWENVDPTRVTN
jgi:hypothetical protein